MPLIITPIAAPIRRWFVQRKFSVDAPVLQILWNLSAGRVVPNLNLRCLMLAPYHPSEARIGSGSAQFSVFTK